MRLLLVVQEVLFVLVVYEKIDFSGPAPHPPPDRVRCLPYQRERERGREGKKKKSVGSGVGFPYLIWGDPAPLLGGTGHLELSDQ